MRRLTLDLCKDGSPGVFDDPDGDLVMWEDVEKLKRERDEARGELEECHAQFEDMLRQRTEAWAEIRDLKSFVVKLRGRADARDWAGMDALTAEAALARAEVVRLREGIAWVWEWCSRYGAALRPPSCDTYGDGMREAKKQVRGILNRVLLDGEGGES